MNKEILSKKEKLFMYLVGTFQSSAWIALGKIKNPMTEKSKVNIEQASFYIDLLDICLLYTSPSPRDGLLSRMPSSA